MQHDVPDNHVSGTKHACDNTVLYDKSRECRKNVVNRVCSTEKTLCAIKYGVRREEEGQQSHDREESTEYAH